MSKKIYLVRHGQTVSNNAGVVQGATDELSELGRKQAEALCQRILSLQFSHLLVSDYTRTRQTIFPALTALSVTPVYTDLVRETRQPSSLIGVSNQDETFLEYYQQWARHAHDPNWHYEDEENFPDIINRVQRLFEQVSSYEGDVLIVSHGRFITYVVMYVITEGKLDWDTWQICRHGFETTNTGISVITYNERYQGYRLLTFNDQAHLGE